MFTVSYLSTSPHKYQTLQNGKVIHGIEEPSEKMMLFQSTYAIHSYNDYHF